MTIGPLVASADAARPTFIALRELSAELRAAHPRLGPALSMGMSDDFEAPWRRARRSCGSDARCSASGRTTMARATSTATDRPASAGRLGAR